MGDATLCMVAFDFGTTYSGYAYSFCSEPLKVHTNRWQAGDKTISYKTPTCVLLNKEEEFHSFGYDAENHFASLAEDDSHQGWLLFRHFKMSLHTNRNLSAATTVPDINGKQMPAMDIFSMSEIFKRTSHECCTETESRHYR
ncbi:heat shock 70 kDa protein 12B-like [Mercenaria mercenaria]|uniref:heat shock 70 kDa protein 12B-like n=1 Tax=Mercenaria mercenaria TaxID=6596 RepID=UPI00234E9575|nr:heat shock 70 kDa protein 12B-like [Mercenaria mercenaria]